MKIVIGVAELVGELLPGDGCCLMTVGMNQRVITCIEPAVQVEVLASTASPDYRVRVGQEHDCRLTQGSAMLLEWGLHRAWIRHRINGRRWLESLAPLPRCNDLVTCMP